MGQENNMPTPSSDPAQTQAPAAAPKLDFAQILSDAWQLGQTKFWNLLGIYLIMTVIMVVVIILGGLAAGAVGFIISLAQLPALLVLYIALAVIGLIVLVLWVSAWGLIASYRYLDHSGNPSVKDVASEAKSQAWGLVPTIVVGALAVVGGFIALVIPGIIMAISLSFVVTVAVFENKKMWPALTRSRDLVRGRWWNIFVLTIAFFILAFILLAATGMSYSPLLILLYPFCYIWSYVMYKKLTSLPAAALPTNRGDWYYKLVAGFGILVIAAGILGATYSAGRNWDEFKAGFNEGFKEGQERNRGGYYDSEPNPYFEEINIPLHDLELMDLE